MRALQLKVCTFVGSVNAFAMSTVIQNMLVSFFKKRCYRMREKCSNVSRQQVVIPR